MKNLLNTLFILLIVLICTTCKKDEEITITRLSVYQNVDALQTTAKITADIDCNTVFSGVEILYDTLISCDNGNTLSMEKGDLDNQYNVILKDLVPNKTYYVKYKIFNKINYLCSNKIEKFSTVPMVSTDSIKMMSDASYKVYSHIISDGGLKISEQGVCYGKTKMPTIQNANKALGTKDTAYICAISNLDFNTIYYFRSYAITSLGISYGDEMEYATAEEKLEVSPVSKIFDSNGGALDVEVTSNSTWTVSSNQSWCTLSKTSGSGNESFKITVASTKETTSSNAVVSIRTKSGIQKNVEIIRSGEPVLLVTPTSKTLEAEGGSFDVKVTSNVDWEVSSDQSWCTLSRTQGSGNGSVTATVMSNKEMFDRSAMITIITQNGLSVNIYVTQEGFKLIVTDCQGHSYPIVKIGEQYWMAENLQCTKYDTKSERAGAEIYTSSRITYAPYYTDGRYATTEYSGNLTQEQRKHLGLLYNWAAAMGYTESQALNQTGSYSGRRQGICPNGWHLPNRADWNTLASYCDGYNIAGKKLKSRSGWYSGGNGTDDYGFSGLPAGYAVGSSSVYNVGYRGYFWSSDAHSSNFAYDSVLCYDNPRLYMDIIDKSVALGVRCLRD